MPSLLGSIIGNKFRITEKMRGGGYGEVYEGKNEESQRMVVVKIERKSDGSSVNNEVKVYRKIQHTMGFPKLYDFGVLKGRHYLILDRLGEDLEDVLRRYHGRFSMATVAMIMIQMLYRIEWLHHLGFIHKDVKPNNIIVGEHGGRNVSKLYLIDFGSAGKFRDGHGRHVMDGRSSGRVAGTPLFAPIRWHTGQVQSRRDDLLSLAYTMVYMYKGRLPWKCDDTESEIYRRKKQIASLQLCSRMPSEMLEFYRSIRLLEFDQRPDYSHLRQLMRRYLSHQGIRNERSFEWV